jgi:hypothetical protein
VVISSSECLLDGRPNSRSILGIHLGKGQLEGGGKRLRDVPVDPIHLIGPRDPIGRDHPLPAPDVGDLLGLGELPLLLAKLPLGFLPLGDLVPQVQVGCVELGRPLPHPGVQLDCGALQRLVGLHPLRHQGGEEERAEGDRRVERLEHEHLLEQRSSLERPDALGGRPRGGEHDEQGRRRSPPLLEPPGRPPQQRDHEEHELQISTNRRQGHQGDQGEEHRSLDVPPRCSPRSVPWQHQAEHEWGDREDTHGVACPPHRPRARQLMNRQRSGCHEGPRSDQGADAHAQQGTHEDDGGGIS